MKHLSLIAALSISSMACFQSCRVGGNPGNDKPNFVWIISEDNSKHYMQLFDPGGIATPSIARMAENGIIFTRAFSNAPVCSVARSTLISSCYAPRTATQFHRKSQMVPMPDGVEMFPVYLRQAGYYTTNNSKEDYNYVKSGGTWDESSTTAHWRNRNPGQPFFHKESHPVSHESRLHFDEAFTRQYKPVIPPGDVRLFPNHPDTDLFRFTAAYYMDRMLSVDTIVASVISQLEEDGLLEDTFVFYFSDHGGVLPGSKGYTYETGLHIPLVVRIPENFSHLVSLEKGAGTDQFVSFVDFGPTLLQLAGLELPEGVDGQPFLGTGNKQRPEEDEQVTFGYADRFDEKYDLVRTVRKGSMKYMRSYQPFNFDALRNNYRYRCLAYQQWREMYLKGELNEIQSRFFEARPAEQLFDLEKDPFETTNLAGDPEYLGVLREMRGLLSGWVKGMPDLSFYPERDLRREAFGNPVEFGQENKNYIAQLVDIADLALLPFVEARTGIDSAIHSADPLSVYWALIVCSIFGEEAAPYYDRARECCLHEDLLVRTRAAEFLALTGEQDPGPVLADALNLTGDPLEALLILNTAVLLMDRPQGYRFRLQEEDLSSPVAEDPEVKRRLEYIRERPGG